MKHQTETFTTFFTEDGKMFWISQDGSWIRQAVRGGDGDEDEDKSKDEDKPVISQKQLNEILTARVGKARDKAVADLLKDLGVESAEALKTVLAQVKNAEEQNATEIEKQRKKAEEAEGKFSSTASELKEFKLKTAIKDALVEEGLKPSEAVLITKLVEVEEDDPEKIKAAIAELKKTMPQVFTSANTPPVNGGNPGTPPPGGGGNGNDPAAVAKVRLYERHPELKKS